MLRLTHWLGWCILAPLISAQCEMGVTPVTYCHLNVTLRAALKEFMDLAPAHDAIGSMTRLMFHDCMGPKEYNLDGSGPISICDGCLDLSNGAHAGLYEEAVARLDRIYLGRLDPNIWFYDKMSRADFWSAAATIAIQYADELNTIDGQYANPFGADNPFLADSLPFIPFYIGRTDCSAAPDINIANYALPYKSFPDALAGFGHNYDFFRDHYDFTVREFVAALGAHTLGNLHEEHSGFGDGLSPWVQEWWLLNNAFYSDLLDVSGSRDNRDGHINWAQVPNQLGSGVYEWVDDQNRVVMINADISLVKDIDGSIVDASTGEISCTYHECPDNTESLPFVEMYHNDNQLWLDDFAKVFTKMMLTGYDVSQLTILAPDGYVTSTSPTQTQTQATNEPTVLVTPDPTVMVTPDPTVMVTPDPTRRTSAPTTRQPTTRQPTAVGETYSPTELPTDKPTNPPTTEDDQGENEDGQAGNDGTDASGSAESNTGGLSKTAMILIWIAVALVVCVVCVAGIVCMLRRSRMNKERKMEKVKSNWDVHGETDRQPSRPMQTSAAALPFAANLGVPMPIAMIPTQSATHSEDPDAEDSLVDFGM